ncbi:MAG: anthranilate phosphoribosyltransferase family protein [Cyanobacteria bacterium J06632_22]
MSDAFRELLKKVGSGSHTSKSLTRTEAASATRMMLEQIATPAQIGAFMIAHRIRRPTPEELAGMLDCYEQLGPQLQPIDSTYPVTVFNSPYDGRSRTAPISPFTALVLAASNAPAVLHGGDRMPTKYGLPLVELWQALGVDWTPLSLSQVQTVFQQTGIGFVYMPRHFPAAQGLVTYREQLGKRPPIATIELMWSPYGGQAHVVSSYVHPPTEARTQTAFSMRGTTRFSTIKGLEGSCDLPRSRTAIIGTQSPTTDFERLLLQPREYGLADIDPPLVPLPELIIQAQAALKGEMNALTESIVWNGGFYLWQSGVTHSFKTGLDRAKESLNNGSALAQLSNLIDAIHTVKKMASPERAYSHSGS